MNKQPFIYEQLYISKHITQDVILTIFTEILVCDQVKSP